MRPKFYFFCLLLTFTGAIAGNPLKEAYEALSVYDYFKARQLFYKRLLKELNPYAEFGLSEIYKSNNNPFYSLDSACKYIHLSAAHYISQKSLPYAYKNYKIDSTTIFASLDSVSKEVLRRIKKQPSIKAYNQFLTTNYLANYNFLKEAVYNRDELEFNRTLQLNKSDSTRFFLITHPQSSFFWEASLLLDKQIYDETCVSQRAEDFVRFISKFPSNVMVPKAYEQLYYAYRARSDKEGLKKYVYDYPNAPQNQEAWKLLFALSVTSFSDESLIRFLAEYPEFPLKNSILKDLQLSGVNFYPYLLNDQYGFIDSTARIVIPPYYDVVGSFNEGLAVVSKNDTVFFINKANEKMFVAFEDAHPFKNGIAPVKQNGQWYFINRQGQSISNFCEEINELSDNIYVIKVKGKYGAVDHYGQKIFDARFDQLGEFKNGYAYYAENGHYGFVSSQGLISKAEFEWISDFGKNNLAVFKLQNKYGLVNSNGNKHLVAEYDQILKLNEQFYLLIKNNFYGFYQASGCFISALEYDYAKEKPIDFYYKQGYFRLLKNKGQAIMDENGVIRVNFKVYEDIGFVSNGLFRVMKKKKLGFVDRKLQNAIPLIYDWASDFEDSVAIVKIKEHYILINLAGKELYHSEAPIQKLSTNYYFIESGSGITMLHRDGRMVVEQVKHIQQPQPGFFIITLNNGEIKLLRDETFVNLNSKI